MNDNQEYYDNMEYYDNIADISVATRDAIESLELAKNSVQRSLSLIRSLKKYGDTTISFVSNVTIDDVLRNLLFFELLLNQTHGVTSTFAFQELLELTSYLADEEGF